MAIFGPALSVLLFFFLGPQTILGAIVGLCTVKNTNRAKGLLIATLVLGILLTIVSWGLFALAFI